MLLTHSHPLWPEFIKRIDAKCFDFTCSQFDTYYTKEIVKEVTGWSEKEVQDTMDWLHTNYGTCDIDIQSNLLK
jgi:hypothetical protein